MKRKRFKAKENDSTEVLGTFSLAPVNFFSVEADCYSLSNGSKKLIKKHRLPDTSTLCGEKSFADVSLGWSMEGIAVDVFVNKPFEQAYYPDVVCGDSVELFFDTRDLKSTGFNTRFCHHFCFLPVEVEGFTAGEITRFRTEDSHELCNPADLQLEVSHKKSAYTMRIFIPAECLYGYDADQFDRLGFTYRINRVGAEPQHFSVLATEYQIPQHPSMWSSLHLKAS